MENLNMNDLEKQVLVAFQKRKEIEDKYKDMSDDQLMQLESELVDLWENDRHNDVLNDRIREVQDELTNREDESMWRSECSEDEDLDCYEIDGQRVWR